MSQEETIISRRYLRKMAGDGFRARDYQVELLEKSLKSDSIVFLRTGAGKTFIAVMLIKEYMHELMPPYETNGKRTFFLVPRVPLVEQQAKMVRDHVPANIGEYCGSHGVDNWNERDWLKELREKHVLVMTPQILVNILESGFLPLRKVNLIIFDECHNATGDHPYSIVMRHLSANIVGGGTLNKPRILGLSASILNTKCKPAKLERMMKELEVSLGAKIVASSDETSVDRFATNPKELVVVCGNRTQLSDNEKRIMDIINRGSKEIAKLQSDDNTGHYALLKNIESYEFPLRDMDEEGFSPMTRMQVSPKKIFKNLASILEILGIDCLTLLLGELVLSVHAYNEETQIDFFKVQAKRIIEKYLYELQFELVCLGRGQNRVTPKLQKLLDVIKNLEWHPNASHQQKARTIVFVEQRVVAWTLANYLKKWKCEASNCRFMEVDFMVGNALQQNILKAQFDDQKTKKQRKVLAEFRTGYINLLVSTNVVEEGLDIPRCNVVVRFDKPKTFCSYVQSKGRARASDAMYILLVEDRDRCELCVDLGDYQSIEKMISDMCVERTPPSVQSMVDMNLSKSKLSPFYVDDIHGAVLTLESAAGTLNRYCSHLPSDRFTKLVPKWKIVKQDFKFKYVMKFPLGCPVEDKVHGIFMDNVNLAKKAAAFEACKLLYQYGELDKHLLPNSNYWERYKAELGILDDEVVTGDLEPKPGTRKRRQLYRIQDVKDLCGSFPVEGAECYLHPLTGYEEQSDGCAPLRFSFGILSRKEISMPWPFLFHTPRGKVTMQMDGCRIVRLTRDQLGSLTACHRYLWDTVLLAVQCPMQLSEMSAFNVLTVPMRESNSYRAGSFKDIDWHYVNSIGTPALTEGSVIRPTYRAAGTFYVESISEDMTPLTRFPSPVYANFARYFEDRYGAVVKDLRQPLVEVRHVSCATNFVLCRDKIVKKENRLANVTMYQIPELCSVLRITVDRLIPLLALPSFLWRMQWMLRVDGLMTVLSREARVRFHQGPVPDCSQFDSVEALHRAGEVCDKTLLLRYSASSAATPDNVPWIFLKAITLLGANDLISMERLETLGDSFLKYAASAHLYCKFHRLNEGILSTLRSKIVCNYNLYAWARQTCLPRVLNANGFDIAKWLPPGFHLEPQLLNLLIDLRVPFYLWKHAGMLEDVAIAGACRDVVIYMLLAKHSQTKNNSTTDAAIGDAQPSVVFNEYEQQLIGDKNVADAVEALMGACLVAGGQRDVLKFTQWLGLRLAPCDVNSVSGIPWKPPQDALVTRASARGTLQNLYGNMKEFEEKLGYTFREKSFLRQALVHPSYSRHVVTNSYQQLEFIGDAVLDYLVTVHLYCMDKEFSPGQMTDIRSSLVDTSTFAYLAVKNDFHKYLEYASPSLFKTLTRYVEKVQEMVHPKDSLYLLNEEECMELDDVECPKALCDVFESVAGAIYVDSGMDLESVWKVYYGMMADVIVRYCVETPISPVRKLFELNSSVQFSRAEKADDKYRVVVKYNSIECVGFGKTKHIAKNSAAKCALRLIQRRSS